MNFTDWLNSREEKTRFEQFLIEHAEKENLKSDVDFEEFFQKFASETAKTSADTFIVADTLYYSFWKKFIPLYMQYLQVKVKQIMAMEKISDGGAKNVDS